MEERKQIEAMLDTVINEISDKETLCVVYAVSETVEIAQEIIDFIKANNIVCHNLMDEEQYKKYNMIDKKCMEIARRENIGTFYD